MFLFLAFFLGLRDVPADSYIRYPSGPAVPLEFNENRTSPWVSDFETTGKFDAPAGTWVPAPKRSDFQTSGTFQLAQNSLTDDQHEREKMELRKRIEELENIVKKLVTQPPVPQPMPAPSADGLKSVPGWIVELHSWNKSGRLSEDPLERVLTRSCPFRGNFRHKAGTNMFIYRFKAIFRAKTPGRYVFANDITCGFGHECGFHFWVDNQQLVNFNGRMDKQRLLNGIPLTVGDHELEFITYLKRNSFIKYEPAERHQWLPLVQAPGDFNPREYRTDELFAVVPQSVNTPVLGCNY